MATGEVRLKGLRRVGLVTKLCAWLGIRPPGLWWSEGRVIRTWRGSEFDVRAKDGETWVTLTTDTDMYRPYSDTYVERIEAVVEVPNLGRINVTFPEDNLPMMVRVGDTVTIEGRAT